jgi:pilus assembly protein CpaC
MHHTNPITKLALCSLLVGLGLSDRLGAQPPPPPAPGAARPAAPRGNTIIIPVNGTQQLQMTTRRRIATVLNQKDTVARITPKPNDPTAVLITGLEPGITRVTLTDENNTQESVDVIVQFDVEYLRTLLVRTIPTANIQPLPGANNTIVLTGTVANAEDVDVIMRTAVAVVGAPDRVVNAMRVGGVMQVQLDVVVAQVSREEFRRMVFNFFENGQQHFLASTVGGAFTVQNITNLMVTNTIGNPNGVAPNAFFSIINNEQGFLGVLQALRDENVAKLHAEPRVVALSGRPASFLSGGEQAVPVPAGLGQIGVQFEEFGTRLNVLPIVLGNGKIHLEIEPEVSELNPAFGTSISGTVVPGRTTQRIHTTVELEDGQTYVLGGLIQHTVVGHTSKVPILGDLPFLGAAFSSKSYDETDEELVILVTPHLVDSMSCDQLPKLLPGMETRSPDDFELFLEGILEAPRGSRVVCPDYHYVPAYKNGPSAAVFPCASGDGRCGNGGCRTGGPGCASCPNPNGAAPIVPDGRAVQTEPAKPAQADSIRPAAADENSAKTGATEPAAPTATANPSSAGDAPVSDMKPPLPPPPPVGPGGI